MRVRKVIYPRVKEHRKTNTKPKERIYYRAVAFDKSLHSRLEQRAAKIGCSVDELIVYLLDAGLPLEK